MTTINRFLGLTLIVSTFILLFTVKTSGAEKEFHFNTQKPEVISDRNMSFSKVKGKKNITVALGQKESIYVYVTKGYPTHIYLPEFIGLSEFKNEAGLDYFNIDGSQNGRKITVSAGEKATSGKTRTNFYVRCINGFELFIELKAGSIDEANKIVTIIDRESQKEAPDYNKSYFYRMKDTLMLEKIKLEQTLQEQFFSDVKKVVFHDKHVIGNSAFFLETVIKTNSDLYINFIVPQNLKEPFKKEKITLRLSSFQYINVSEKEVVVNHLRPHRILSYENDKADRITLIFHDALMSKPVKKKKKSKTMDTILEEESNDAGLVSNVLDTFTMELDIGPIRVYKKVDLSLQKPVKTDLFFDPVTQF